MIWIVYCCLVLCVMECISDGIGSTTAPYDDYCEKIKCVGVEYSCRNRTCYCAEGYIPNYSYDRCIKCPGLGESCIGKCCSNTSGNETLMCWQGVCQQCHDKYGEWICRGTDMNESLLISNTKMAIDTAVIFIFVATFILVLKFYFFKNLRPMTSTISNSPRLSIGSMQMYIDERLRNAPPKYSIAPPSDAPHPFTIYLDNRFVHDSSIPPPPYTPEGKAWDSRNTILHI